MQQFKRAQVKLLPTKEKSSIHSIISTNRLVKWHCDIIPSNDACQNQHLYIISDEEIKKGDWVYVNVSIIKENDWQSINKVESFEFVSEQNFKKVVTDNGKAKYAIEKCKKIIVTTDKLNIHPNIADSYRSGNCLPQPSQQFIQKYIESYNKGEIITDVLVEYEELEEYVKPRGCSEGDYYQGNGKFKLKVNPKDNTITIKKLKDSWNREEVEKLIQTACDDCCFNPTLIDKWIEDNL